MFEQHVDSFPQSTSIVEALNSLIATDQAFTHFNISANSLYYLYCMVQKCNFKTIEDDSVREIKKDIPPQHFQKSKLIKSALLHTSKTKLKMLLKIKYVREMFNIFLVHGLDKESECFSTPEY
jgi:hypothetical protein